MRDGEQGVGGLRSGLRVLAPRSLVIIGDPRRELETPPKSSISWPRTGACSGAAMKRDPSPDPFILSLDLGLGSGAEMETPLSLQPGTQDSRNGSQFPFSQLWPVDPWGPR